VSAALPLASILWLPVGLAVALLLAASGRLGEGAVIVLTLAPAAALLLMGLCARAWEEILVRRARGTWFRQPGREEHALSEVDAWCKDLGDVGGPNDRDDALRHSKTLGYVVIGVGVLGAVALFPPFALAPTAAVAPIMASVAIPRRAQTQERASQAEALRPCRLPASGETTPAKPANSSRASCSWDEATGRPRARSSPSRDTSSRGFPDLGPQQADRQESLHGSGGRTCSLRRTIFLRMYWPTSSPSHPTEPIRTFPDSR